MAYRDAAWLEIATKLGFLDLHLKRTVDEIREGASIADEVLDDWLVAFANEVIQECTSIELAQEFDILFRQIAIRQDDIDIIAQCGKVEIVEVIAQCVRAGFQERLSIEGAPLLQNTCENVEELRMVERANTRFLGDVEGELGDGIFTWLLIDENALGEFALKRETKVVAKLPDDECFFINEVVIESFAILARSLDDVGNRYLLKGHFFAEFYECIRNKEFRIKRAHPSFPSSGNSCLHHYSHLDSLVKFTKMGRRNLADSVLSIGTREDPSSNFNEKNL